MLASARRNPAIRDDEGVMIRPDQPTPSGSALLALYDHALPQFYGYFVARVGTPVVAEDLTSATFLAAVDAIGRGTLTEPTTAWLIGVARHKLVDHWCQQARAHPHPHPYPGGPDHGQHFQHAEPQPLPDGRRRRRCHRLLS
jgi:DNA-directed RNA polymerase specialized sigma24 family protein